jgi:glutaredoxin 2
MNSINNETDKIFLCRKIKRKSDNINSIFYINKVKKYKTEIEQFESTLDTTVENDNKNEKKIPSIEEIFIPSFLNDLIIIKKGKYNQKLRKYSEISTQFNDSEEVEVYLIKKENLLNSYEYNIY